MRRFFPIRSIALALVGLVSSSPDGAADSFDNLIDAVRNDPSPTKRLGKEEAMEDVRTLAHILKEGYAGWEVLDFDWNRAFVKIAKDINSQTSLGARDFVGVFVKHFAGVEDRHLGFFLGKGRRREWYPVYSQRDVLFSGFIVEPSSHNTWEVADTPRRFRHLRKATLLKVEGEAPTGFLYRTGATGRKQYLVGSPSFQDSKDTLAMEFQLGEDRIRHKAPIHPSQARLASSHPRPYRLTRIPYPRIELGSFSALYSVELEEFVRSADDLREEPMIVLDLRGNSGGSDRFGKEWLESLTGRTFQTWNIRELVSPVTLQGDVLLHEWLLANNGARAAKEEAGGRLAYFKERLAEGRRNGLERKWIDVPGPPSDNRETAIGKPFHGRLILLTDRGTQSSAETFVLMARQVPGPIRVGENPGGMIRFGEIKLYRLPNSGIWVQAGSKHFEDPTGAFREGWGFAPDHWSDDSSSISSISRMVERLSGSMGAGSGTGTISSSAAGGE